MFLCECFFTLRNQAAKIIDIDKGKTRYITNHPIIENKEMNKRIALEAFGSREQDELQKYQDKAKMIARSVAYLHRFYIPNQRNVGNMLTVRGHQIPFFPFYDMATFIWDLKVI